MLTTRVRLYATLVDTYGHHWLPFGNHYFGDQRWQPTIQYSSPSSQVGVYIINPLLHRGFVKPKGYYHSFASTLAGWPLFCKVLVALLLF